VDRRVRLTVGPAAIAVIFGAIIFALVGETVLEKGRRPLGWALAAAVAAAAVEPLVARASKYMRRGLALVVVLVPLLGFVGLVTWGVVGDLDAQVRRLQRDIPEVAAEIEDGQQMGDAAQEFELTDKAQEFADSLRRPSSRVGQEAVGGASTWVLTLILTLFALGWGPRFADAAVKQVPEGRRRERLARVVGRAFLQSQTYIEVAVLMAVVTGFLAFAVFRMIDLPAPTPLALVVGVGTLVPSIGIALATVPAALLAGGLISPSTGIALGLGAIALQIVHAVVLRRATRGAAHPGAAVIVISFVIGYELYGVGGSVVGTCVTVFLAALLDSIAEEEREEIPAPASMPGVEPVLEEP
jgi:predicted PurR-regulated permease PerM